MYKTKLQELCQKRRWEFPQYSAMKDGPDHNPRFKASVFINGVFFHSPPSCFSFKEAQTGAARAALDSLSSSLSANEALQEVDFAYKNLLQELTRRKLLHQPSYRTLMAGPLHLPTFFSSVAIGSETFSGEAGNSKKAAEMNAAKVAYTALKLAFDESPPKTESNLTAPEEASAGTLKTSSGSSVQSPEASRLVEDAATGDQTVAQDSSLHTSERKRKFRRV